MARKTAQDYMLEHNKLEVRLSALESRIENRCKQLVKKQPDIPYNDEVTVQEMLDVLWCNDRYDRIQYALNIIQIIEEYNLKQAGIVQTTIPYKS